MQGNWITPWFSQYGYGNSYGLAMPCSVYNQYPYGGCWIQPRQLVYHIYEQRTPRFEAKKLSKRGGRYYMTERNGREVYIGEMDISNPLVVGPRDDGSFDCIFCELKGEGMPEKRACKFPQEAIRKQNPLRYIPDFHRNPDCPTEYINAAFFEELFTNNDSKFLNLPPHSGWNHLDSRWCFVSAESIIPQLAEYYAPDIPQRQLLRIDTMSQEADPNLLQQAAEKLALLLPNNEACRTLLTANASSILLGFFEGQQIKPDRLIIVGVDCENQAKLATVLLQNCCFTDTYISSLYESRSVLQNVLDSVWDGNVLFRDSSYVENHKRRAAGLDVLLEDLHRGQGLHETNRHCIVVITDNPANDPTDLPAVFINLCGCPQVENLEELQQAVGTFLTALINTLEQSDYENNLVTCAMNRTPLPKKTVDNDGEIGTATIMRCTARLLTELGVFDQAHMQELDKLFQHGADVAFDQHLAVLNESRTVLSSMIENGELQVANQYGPPYFSEPSTTVMIDSQYVNFMTEVRNRITANLKTTQRHNTMLRAWKACGKLHANNGYKRLVDVEIAPGRIETLNFYSTPRAMLTPSCQAKLNGIRYADYMFPLDDYPECFVPVVQGENGLIAGRVITDATDEAESIYASGKTRTGKTSLIENQAVIRADCGDITIFFDQTGSFLRDEQRKRLREEIIDEYFSRWEIGELGLPVNLLSLENCKSLPDKKQRLASVLSGLARLTGDVQIKVLRSRLAKIVKGIEAGQVRSLADTLRFFDEDDPDQAEIRERLAEAFEDLEGLPNSQMTWGDFIASQGRIIVISTASDGIRKSSQFIDALLASLYAWKQHNRTERMTVVLDEIEELSLERDGPLNTILRKGSKHRMSMLLASQEYSAEKDKLGKLIGNCGMQIIFHPKDACIDGIAKKYGIDRQQLATLEQGECFAVGGFYSRQQGKNKLTTIRGKAYSAAKFLHLEPSTEPEPDETASEEVQTESQDLPVEQSEVPELSETETAVPESPFCLPEFPEWDETEPDGSATEPLFLPIEQPSTPDTEDDTSENSLPETSGLTSLETALPETENAENEEHPASPESEPDAPEEDPQEIVELELQEMFRSVRHSFHPDHPCLTQNLSELLDEIMSKHRFASSDERDDYQTEFESLICCTSPSNPHFRDLLQSLYYRLWPDAETKV